MADHLYAGSRPNTGLEQGSVQPARKLDGHGPGVGDPHGQQVRRYAVETCVFCRSSIRTETQHMVTLAGCGHFSHYECFFGMNLVRRVGSCPECIPDVVINDDYGDCIYAKDMHLDHFVRDNIEVAVGMRVNEYKTSEIIAHAAAVAHVDAAETTADHVSRMIRKTGGVPARALRPWLPGVQDAAHVKALLHAHVRPKQLRASGVDVVTILNANVSFDEIIECQYTLKEIHEIGFDMRTLVALGFRAGHMRNKGSVPVVDVRNVFKMSFEDIIQLENRFYPKPFGALIAYCSMEQDLEGHRILGLTTLDALRPHGLNSIALQVLAKDMPLSELASLGLTVDMLEEFDMLNADDLKAVGVHDPATAAVILRCDPRKLMPVPPSTLPVCDAETDVARDIESRLANIPHRATHHNGDVYSRINPEHRKLMQYVFD